jgi:hypothetical protein
LHVLTTAAAAAAAAGLVDAPGLDVAIDVISDKTSFSP